MAAARVVIVDYDAGNLRSVQRACRHVGIDADISGDPEVVLAADKVIFPGVGSAVSAVDTLNERGLGEALRQVYREGKPLLGICLGLQIVLEHTAEGDRDCLGLLAGECRKFAFDDRSLKVPHIGWNDIEISRPHPLLANLTSGDEVYFVHSYYACPASQDEIFCTTTYGDICFASAIGRENLFATQFHLEKSGRIGLRLLEKFGSWEGGEC